MKDILFISLFGLTLVAPILLGVLALSLAAKRDAKRLNPLTKSLRRPPGGHLSRQLVGLYFDLAANLGFLSLSVSLPAALYLFQSHVLEKPDTTTRLILIGVVAIVMFSWALKNLISQRNQLQSLRIGYECELAVGQELDQLVRDGFHVFHDIQADKFNVDHIVVGLKGVFVIETKGRSKRQGTAGPNKADYNVQYESGVLKFPGWSETAPIQQAISNAQWVSLWLSKATGFQVKAEGIVVLPGWYINRKTVNPVPVLAVGAIPGFFRKHEVQTLSEQQVGQIVYQIEQKSMDIKPGDALRPLEVHS